MERIGVVGLSWRLGDPEALARFALPAEGRRERLAELAREVDAEELVHLATCNRVEVAFVTREGVPVEEYRRRLHAALGGGGEELPADRAWRAWAGEGAVEHLFLVAAGLDSARLGETEILGQVREALDEARAAGVVAWRLPLLLEEALKVGRRARRATGLDEGRTSLAEIGLDAVRARLGGRPAAQGRPGRVAVVGVSPMTERCARALAAEGCGVVVANRTLARAEALAAELGERAVALSLDDLRAAPPALDALVSATGAAGPVLARADLERLVAAAGSVRGPLVVDFATDPDVDPEACGALGLERLGMTEVIAEAERSREERLRQSGAARELVDEAVAGFGERIARRRADRSIAALRASYERTAATQVERLLEKHLADLDDERRELLRRFAGRLAAHFAHVPATGLRELAAAHGAQLVNEFFARADEALARDLDEALADREVFGAPFESDEEEVA